MKVLIEIKSRTANQIIMVCVSIESQSGGVSVEDARHHTRLILVLNYQLLAFLPFESLNGGNFFPMLISLFFHFSLAMMKRCSKVLIFLFF